MIKINEKENRRRNKKIKHTYNNNRSIKWNIKNKIINI